MKSNINNDWYNELKYEIVDFVMFFKDIKEVVIYMLLTNRWILEDINLSESFTHLKEMIDVSNEDLEKFIKTITLLENNSTIFNMNDLIDEFDYIKENISLESSFITNLVNYMAIITDPSINDLEIIDKLEEYQEIDISCYNQMKINNKGLKKLRKERRDYFE